MSPPNTGEIYVGGDVGDASPDAEQVYRQTRRENRSLLEQIGWKLAELKRQGRENLKAFDDLSDDPLDDPDDLT